MSEAHTDLNDLITQQAELAKQIAELKKNNRKEAVEQVKNLMTQYDITVEDLAKKTSSAAGVKVPPKWQDPVSGAKWSGRGRTPAWFNEETAIKL
jgi:DNA-binding protein H-NS